MRVLIGVLASLLLLVTALADDGAGAKATKLQAGLDAAERGDHMSAVRIWRSLAEGGHVQAQYHLGTAYRNGRGVPKNDAAAVKWYRLAAEQGDPRAQHNLGASYRNGRGVPQDEVEAAKWYRLAAEQGLLRAQHALGLLYATGEGVALDKAEAYAWLNVVAAQGVKKAAEKRRHLADSMTAEEREHAQQLSAKYWETYVLPLTEARREKEKDQAREEATERAKEAAENAAISAYLSVVYKRLREHSYFPSEAERAGLNGRVVLAFNVLSDGQVIAPRIVEHEGNEVFRRAALRSLELAGDMPPFPEAIRRPEILVMAPINYGMSHLE